MGKISWKSATSARASAKHSAGNKRAKSTRNQLVKSNASSKAGVGRPKHGAAVSGGKRSAETVARLKMYNNGKAIRNRRGHVVAGNFMMSNRAGDREITAQTGRIQPDRRWFGNTRTVDPKQLDVFRQEMTAATADPYSVVLKRKKVPMGLLQDAAEYCAGKAGKAALLDQEPFEQAFGSKSRRKKVKIDQLLSARSAQDGNAKKKLKTADGSYTEKTEGKAEPIQQQPEGDGGGYLALMNSAQKSQETYDEINNREGIVPWGRDGAAAKNVDAAAAANTADAKDVRSAARDILFSKGQSKRIWGEFFKVLDCSDVVLHVIDCRNVPGTRCNVIEKMMNGRDNQHKHLVFVLNKIDLVPSWVAKRWMGELAKYRPTIAFHASQNHAFGKGALINLLRQFAELHSDKKQISVGVVGYPNVGKSSIINCITSNKKACKVAPIPGETKIWQYVTLFKRIALIDSPGVVVDSAGDTETDSVLKGVVRAEKLEHPEDFVPAVELRVKREHIAAQYKLADKNWKDANDLMERVAKQFGRLRKGGDPCIRSAAIMILYDFQRGRLPHYVAPPELKDGESNNNDAVVGEVDEDNQNKRKEVVVQEQDLDKIGQDEGSNDNAGKDDEKATQENGTDENIEFQKVSKSDADSVTNAANNDHNNKEDDVQLLLDGDANWGDDDDENDDDDN